MRQEVAQLILNINQQIELFGFDAKADMHVHAKYKHLARDFLHVVLEVIITLARIGFLLFPAREGMGAGCYDAIAVTLGDRVDLAPQPPQFHAGFGHIAADGAAHFDLRLHKLRLYLIADLHDAIIVQEFLNDRRQFAGGRVDQLIFFFNADGQWCGMHLITPCGIPAILKNGNIIPALGKRSMPPIPEQSQHIAHSQNGQEFKQ